MSSSGEFGDGWADGPAETMLRVGAITANKLTGAGTMRTGPWTSGPGGRPMSGSLGVVFDNTLAAVVLANRAPGTWAVSTEIMVTICSTVPVDEQDISVDANIVAVNAATGLAQGTIRDPAGRILATGSQRLQYFPRDAPRHEPAADDVGGTSTAVLTDFVAEATRPDDPGLVMELTAGREVGNPMGMVHGGISLWVSEMAALAALQPVSDGMHTASIHQLYLRPMPLGIVRFVTEVTHHGRSLASVRVIARRPDGKPCAIATVTFQRMP